MKQFNLLRRKRPLAVRGFCADCGSPLSFEYGDSDHISVSVGALDQPEHVTPTQHGGIESKNFWVTIDGIFRPNGSTTILTIARYCNKPPGSLRDGTE
jgi:hypothetical protein